MPTLTDLSLADPLLWLLCLASLLVGLSKGGLPGVGMLAVPILSLLISPVVAAVLLLPIFILSDVVAVWLYRRDYSAENLQVLIPAGLLGVLLGWATAAYVSDQVVSFLIGALGITFCLSQWLRRGGRLAPRPVDRRRGLFWGTMSGFTSFVSHAGAPPYQLYMLPQQLPKLVFAGTTTLLFACVNLAKVIPYASLHPYSDTTLWLSAALVPVAGIGTVAGKLLVQALSEKWFYQGVQIALFLISMKLVQSGLWTVLR
ncbi:MAG: sulfite exporter TauE/SafE family protein [Granulosicoccus sp.]|nr:sulfite exporter TauE/SafE family protein [Granulosicoccus sp.]